MTTKTIIASFPVTASRSQVKPLSVILANEEAIKRRLRTELGVGVRGTAGLPNITPVYGQRGGQITTRGLGQNAAGAVYEAITGLEGTILQQLVFSSNAVLTDLIAQALPAMTGTAQKALAEFAGNAGRLMDRRQGLETVNQGIAEKARVKVLESYAERVRPKPNKGYRRRRRLTGRILRALESPSFIEATRLGVNFGNENMLDRTAAHWHRLNYGTEGGISQRAAPQYPLGFSGGGGFLSDTDRPSPAFSLPEGFFFDVGTGARVPFGAKSGSEGFAPHTSKGLPTHIHGLLQKLGSGRQDDFLKAFGAQQEQRGLAQKHVSKGIRGYRFFDAGIQYLATNLPKAWEEIAIDWFDQAFKAIPSDARLKSGVHTLGTSSLQRPSRWRVIVAAIVRHPVIFLKQSLHRRQGMSLAINPPRKQAEVLERLVKLPVHTWTYGWEHPSVQHLGPMAQDFAAAFGLGDRDDMINLVDANGVLMASLQALHARLVAAESELADLHRQLAVP